MNNKHISGRIRKMKRGFKGLFICLIIISMIIPVTVFSDGCPHTNFEIMHDHSYSHVAGSSEHTHYITHWKRCSNPQCHANLGVADGNYFEVHSEQHNYNYSRVYVSLLKLDRCTCVCGASDLQAHRHVLRTTKKVREGKGYRYYYQCACGYKKSEYRPK